VIEMVDEEEIKLELSPEERGIKFCCEARLKEIAEQGLASACRSESLMRVIISCTALKKLSDGEAASFREAVYRSYNEAEEACKMAKIPPRIPALEG